jgi:hypothetical protein
MRISNWMIVAFLVGMVGCNGDRPTITAEPFSCGEYSICFRAILKHGTTISVNQQAVSGQIDAIVRFDMHPSLQLTSLRFTAGDRELCNIAITGHNGTATCVVDTATRDPVSGQLVFPNGGFTLKAQMLGADGNPLATTAVVLLLSNAG